MSDNLAREQIALVTPVETIVAGTGQVRFFEGVQFLSTLDSGALDLSPVNGQLGGPQFRLVFDWVTLVGSTTVNIGTLVSFGNVFNGGGDVTNTSITISVTPEPSTAHLLAFGLGCLIVRRR